MTFKENIKILLKELRLEPNIKEVSLSDIFISYKGYIYVIDISENFYDQVKRFNNILINDGFNLKGIPEMLEKDNSFDSLLHYLRKKITVFPNIIVMEIIDYSTENILEIHDNEYFNIINSKEIKKIVSFFYNIIDFVYVDKIKYNKDYLLTKEIKKPDLLYHGTNSDYLVNILKKGLRPMKDKTVFKQVLHEDHIFLTTSFLTAKKYSQMSVSQHKLNVDQIVLEIDGNINYNKIDYDFDFYNKFIKTGNNSYDNIINNISIKQPLRYDYSEKIPDTIYKKFGYKGIILPSKIKSFWYIEPLSYKKPIQFYNIEEYYNFKKMN